MTNNWSKVIGKPSLKIKNTDPKDNRQEEWVKSKFSTRKA
jgi:hypothetical protein